MKRRLKFLALVWLILLVASHAVRRLPEAPAPEPEPPIFVQQIAEVRADLSRGEQVRVTYQDVGPRDAPAILLLHGSPGSRSDFRFITATLAESYRVLSVDLPGFGDSTRKVDDYSIRSHARYSLDLLQQLEIEDAHLVGFSMGGGVALEMYRQQPQAVRSLTLLAAIGVQELELFGDYTMNHLVHGAQLTAIRFVEELIPHFGLFDGLFFGSPYARNFFDTDQRPLRAVLESFEPPLFVLHGERDPLVPPAAAIEHARIVPQAELDLTNTDHFLLFRSDTPVGRKLLAFLDQVERGEVPTRSQASEQRVAESLLPFDPADIPPPQGIALTLIVVSIALATLVSEDLTCIFAGLMVGQGRLPFVAAAAACCIGIFIGDMMLFLAGRWLGRPALAHRPLRWFIREEMVDQSSRWFNRRGPIVIAISRFIPGMRLPTYFAAGLLRTSALAFGFYFALAVAVWTPILVGASAWVGERAFDYFEVFQRNLIPAMLLLGLWILLMVKLIIPAFSWRGRRRLLGAWRRWTRWEFWPPWLFYPPVVVYILWLGIKHRHPLAFTAANPSIEAGGFIAESKLAILDGLKDEDGFVARYVALPSTESVDVRRAIIERFQATLEQPFPIVLKPDAGQRGSGVAIAKDAEAIDRYLETADFDAMAQEFAPGDEFGVFYIREPGEERGRIFSITEKRLPRLIADGKKTIEQLVLSDDRAVAVADHYLKRYVGRLDEVPRQGAELQLVELGTHCRGAIFLNGWPHRTEELEATIDRISRRFNGFYFGRYDLRTPSIDHFRQGGDFKIVELNGVTSEATHIYDPAASLIDGWRTLFRQWRVAFEIGSTNRRAGHPAVGFGQLLRLLAEYRTSSRHHPG